ncbi:hypothetical protein AMJ49_03045 [Parcubacteria bacterium DG_74_2]|nr:MAG: hypothetical protein AMJ49_03045 [Parcubacteria bacterium DG_74_2]
MKTIIKVRGIELTKKLEEFIKKEIDHLEKFAKDIFSQKDFNDYFGKGKPKVEAWIEITKKTPFFYAECQMRFPRKTIRVESLKKNLKQGIIELKDKLQREIKEYKEKIISKGQRRTRVLKRDLKLSPLARFYKKGRIREEGR